MFLIFFLAFLFKNVESQTISCNYTLAEFNRYQCRMEIWNSVGSDMFTSIDGRHMSGRTNSDVVSLLGVTGTTRIFPSIICRSFTNLATITFRSMQVETLTTNSFVDCRRLEFIDLGNL